MLTPEELKTLGIEEPAWRRTPDKVKAWIEGVAKQYSLLADVIQRDPDPNLGREDTE